MMYFNELILLYFGSGVHQFSAPALFVCGYAVGILITYQRSSFFSCPMSSCPLNEAH